MRTGQKGVALIKFWEGVHDGDLSKIGLQPKLCPAGIWTVGYGHALINKKTGKWLKGTQDFHLIAEQYPEFLNMTEAQAEALLRTDNVKFEVWVNSHIRVPITQGQFDALVSHTFNTGGSDTLVGMINSKADPLKIREWWSSHYVTSAGVRMKGLVSRRCDEADLFVKSKI